MMSPRRSTKNRASRTACSRATSRAGPTKRGSRAEFIRPAPRANRFLRRSQEENRRPPVKRWARRRTPLGNRAVLHLLGLQRQVDGDAKAQVRTARQENRVDECVVAIWRFDKKLRRSGTCAGLIELPQRRSARGRLYRQITVEREGL